jgi:hypothetical protein
MSNRQKPENRVEPLVPVQASARGEALPFEHPAAQPQKLLTGDLLRRLFNESAVPVSDMQTEAEVVSWWKLYAGRVRNALKGSTHPAATEGLPEFHTDPLQLVADSPEAGRGMCDRTPSETQPTVFKHYLWLFNRQKAFLREEVVESSAPLTFEELAERYNQMHDRLAGELWPAKIGWIDWSTTPRDTPAQ